jgi:protein-S-isoprenylcysteine O-methyltransferase Ste14
MKKVVKDIFKFRSYTPIPFMLIMIIFQEATLTSLFVGFIILAIGEFFRLWGVSYAGSETRTTGGGVGATYLVVSGAFAHVRNPLYFGNMLIYTGIGVMSLAWYPYLMLLTLAFFYLQYHIIIREEENFLLNKFGDSFQDYMNKVPRWIPTSSYYKNPGLEQPPFNLIAGIKSEKRTLQAISLAVVLLVTLYLVIN